jgi:hypothetical protein
MQHAGNLLSPMSDGDTPPPTPADALQSLDCSLNVRGGQVECRAAAPSTGGASGLIVGNQGVYVKLTGTNIQSIAPDTTAFDVTVQNLIPQALGVDATGAVDAGPACASSSIRNRTRAAARGVWKWPTRMAPPPF